MSAFRGKTDIASALINVCFDPKRTCDRLSVAPGSVNIWLRNIDRACFNHADARGLLIWRCLWLDFIRVICRRLPVLGQIAG
jgi:hypothetical protein